MNPSQNYTSKLYLEPVIYPGDDKTTYFVPQAAVNEIIAAGHIPEISIKDFQFAENGPKIAVLLTRDKHPDRELADYSMTVALLEAISLSGGRPCFVTYETTGEQLEAFKPDGILLPGGAFDVPLDWEVNEPEHPVSLARCNAYLANIEYAKKYKLPLLGICGGMQVLACYFGARITRVSGHKIAFKEPAHKVNVAAGSLLEQITGKEFDVNSWHSWAVSSKHLGNNLAHFSPDNIVEAIEPRQAWHRFVLGIQSHPEYFVKKGHQPSVDIFKTFIKECICG